MINAIIQALCVGVMCVMCFRIGVKKGTEEAQHVIMMMLRGKQND